MKAMLVLTLPVLASCASWTPADSYREGAALALMAVDYGQTLNIAKHPEQFYERNPILGKHPSEGEVTAYFATAAAAHVAISALLPPKWREIWQWGTIGVEAGVVGYNYSIGIRADF